MTGPANFEILLPDTAAVLQRLIESAPFLDRYSFVGGSAIALHLAHRKSEDLDFFTWDKTTFDSDELRHFLSSWPQSRIINLSDTQVDVLLNGVKVTFFNAAWPFLRPAKPRDFNLATLESLAAMKVNVLFMRAKYRDYYDLYFLVKQLGLQQVYRHACDVVDGLTEKLFYAALTYIDDIEDDNMQHLAPAVQLSTSDIRAYLESTIPC